MPVRFAVIGCGSIARHRHVKELAENKQAKLISLCDIVKPRAEELAKQYGVPKVYTDWREAVADKEVDAVVVATPNYLHAPMTIAALQAGKHVLCEKPMATSAAEAEQMIAAAKAAGRFLMIGHNQRLMPPHVKAKEILQSGRLGRVLTFRTTFGHAGPEGWCVDKSVNSWFFRKSEAFVGAMGDLGVHKADLIRWLLGEEVVEVGAFVTTRDKRYANGELIDVDDNATCVLRTENGIIGNLIASWTYRGGEDNGTILYCEKGVLSIGYDPRFQVVVKLRNGSEECYNVGAIATNERQVGSGVSELFVKCILSNTPPEISGEEGYRALKIVLACLESAATKQIVPVK
jgi:UDP-N-acetylglucosamine 3-dehydrogenase